MKGIIETINESLMNEARAHKCVMRYIEYDRGGGDGYYVQFTAEDHLDMVMKIVENLNFYLPIESFTDPDEADFGLYVKPNATPDEREKIYTQALEHLMEQNGDGCDFIVSLYFDREDIVDDYDEYEYEDVFPSRPKKENW